VSDLPDANPRSRGTVPLIAFHTPPTAHRSLFPFNHATIYVALLLCICIFSLPSREIPQSNFNLICTMIPPATGPNNRNKPNPKLAGTGCYVFKILSFIRLNLYPNLTVDGFRFIP